MIIGLLVALAFSLAFIGCASSPPHSSGITTETFMLPALDAGIELHVRNKHPPGEERFAPERIVLFVHGATFPAETGFDIELPGGSWMDIAAQSGFDAYCVDVRGYGRSTRPAAMEQPPEANPPFADTREAVRDISAAVDFIRRSSPLIPVTGLRLQTRHFGELGYQAVLPLDSLRGRPVSASVVSCESVVVRAS